LFGGQAVEDPAFSPYSVVRYAATYGLKAENLPKFAAGSEERDQPAGAYYRAYKNRIRQLVEKGNTVTPHLDRRWHLPAYLPDLNSTLWTVEKQKIDRALILGYLKACDFDGKSLWVYFGADGSQEVRVDGLRLRQPPGTQRPPQGRRTPGAAGWKLSHLASSGWGRSRLP
jgi:hypothetical protein